MAQVMSVSAVAASEAESDSVALYGWGRGQCLRRAAIDQRLAVADVDVQGPSLCVAVFTETYWLSWLMRFALVQQAVGRLARALDGRDLVVDGGDVARQRIDLL